MISYYIIIHNNDILCHMLITSPLNAESNPPAMDSCICGSYPAWLRKVDGTTKVPAGAWSNGRKIGIDLPPTLKAAWRSHWCHPIPDKTRKFAIMTITVSVQLKPENEQNYHITSYYTICHVRSYTLVSYMIHESTKHEILISIISGLS